VSHFTVLVIGDDIEGQLAPYHEFECTGEDNEFVKDVNKTDEVWKAYAEDTTSKVRAPDGTVYDAYDARFYRDQTPEERARMLWSTKIREVPVEWEEFEETTSESKTFAEFATDWYGLDLVTSEDEIDTSGPHKYGYVLTDGEGGDVVRVIKRTNPDKKWDWYVVGGRWKATSG
jgi:hypothetical protein